MKIAIPLTGKVVAEEPLTGDGLDPIRPVDIDLGNVSWVLDRIDLENEVAVIEVTPSEYINVQVGEQAGEPVFEQRKATVKEKQGALLKVQNLVHKHSKDELYAMSKCHRLERPVKKG